MLSKKNYSIPPATVEKAREIFAYAAQRVTTLSKPQLVNLARAKIVPVVKNEKLKYVAPNLCFLDTQDKEPVWEDIFDFVDFGDRANLFLEALGVKDRPDATQIAEQLAREPKRIYDSMDATGYLRLLGTLGINVAALQRDKALWTMLKNSAFLLGLATVTEEFVATDVATLAKAQDIVIVDEPRLGVIFRGELVIAPERDDCEALYMALGAPQISALVRQRYRSRGAPTTNDATDKLQTHIIERAGIFLTLPEVAPHVAKSPSYFADNLRLYSYDSILVERTLVFGRIRATNSESVTAVIDSTAKGCLLLVTDPARVNYNQVAESLNGVVLKKTNRGTDLMFETILKENLEFLRFRGFAVDRLLNRHQEEQRMAKAKKEAEEKERRLQARLREEQTREETRRAAEVAAATPEMNGNGHIRGCQRESIQNSWSMAGTYPTNNRRHTLRIINSSTRIPTGRTNGSAEFNQECNWHT